jgi:tetratricopeptide (TPR) repeat protein
MGTKEVMVTAPVMVLFYDRSYVAGSFRAAWRARWRYYLCLAATWGALAGLVASTGGNRSGSVGFGTGVSWGGYVLTQFQAVTTYLRLAVWPHPLVFEYGTFWVTAAQAAPYIAFVAALAGLSVWALVRRPRLGFLGFWFFGILAPTSLAPGTTQMIVEHRMYLPLAAPAILFVLCVRALSGRGRIVAVAAAAGLGWTTAGRNADYRTDLLLWQKTAEQRPLNSRAHGNLADALVAAGRTDDGLAEYERALRLNPDDAVASNNYGLALASLGRMEEAVARLRRAVAIKPSYAHGHYNLANALARSGRFDAAISEYRKALDLAPDYSEAANNLGNALMSAGRMDEALARFRDALRMDPENAEADYNLGNALSRLDRTREAEKAYGEALRLHPGYAEAHANLGIALARDRRIPEALEHFREAARIDPGNAEAHFNLGNGLLLAGRTTDAAAEFEKAISLRPDYPPARRGLDEARRRAPRTEPP